MQAALSLFTFALVALMGIAGLCFLVVGIRGQNRGARSCPKCWQLLDETSGGRCPECGHVTTKEKKLWKTNRGLMPFLMCILLLVGAAFLAQRTSNPRTFWQWMPDSALVLLAPKDLQQRGNGPRRELLVRMRSQRLSSSALKSLMDNAIIGSSKAPPGTRAWTDHYEQIIFVLLQSIPEDDPLRDRVYEIEPVVSLQIPKEWPPDQPAIALLTMDRVSNQYRDHVEVTVKNVRNEPNRFRHNTFNRSRFPLVLELPQPGNDGLTTAVHCTIAMQGNNITTFTRSFDVQIDPEPALPNTLKPIDSPELTELIMECFKMHFSIYDQGVPPWSMRFNAANSRNDALKNTLIGLDIELLRNNKVVRRSFIWWHGDDCRPAWETMYEDEEGIMAPPKEDDLWNLRITGRPEIALRASIASDVPASTFWSGSFVQPIEVVQSSGRNWPREWEPVQPNTNEMLEKEMSTP